MNNNDNFSFDNIENSPSYNFINSMNNSDLIGTNDDDVNDSPYSKLKLSCSYMDETQLQNFLTVKNSRICRGIFRVYLRSLMNFKSL